MDVRAPFGRIVVATNYSAHAQMALDRAIRLPLGLGASVDLLHVIPGEQHLEPAEQVEGMRLLRQAFRDALATSSRRAFEVVTSLRHGEPFAVVVDHAHHSGAELVVLGRHGERRFRDMLIGSTAERVIRHGSVSVLVVGSRPDAPYRRPLVAVDRSDSSRLALELAARICEPEVAEIDVVHVLSMPSRLQVSETQLVPALERRFEDLKRETRAELDEWLSEVNLGVRWSLAITSGDPRASILEEARRRGADLIAIGTKGRAGIARVLLGSVAEGVIRGAPSDVLVARVPE